MNNNKFQSVPALLETPEILDAGNAISGYHASSLSTVAINGFSSLQESSISTNLSSPEYDSHLTLEPLILNSNGVIANKSSDSNDGTCLNATYHPPTLYSNSAMPSSSSDAAGPAVAVTVWMDTVVCLVSDIKRTEASAREETALILVTLRDSGTARSAKRPYEFNTEYQEDLVVQSPKRTSLGVDFESQRQAASSSEPSYGFGSVLVRERPTRTPLPPSRNSTKLDAPVPDSSPEPMQKTAFSQSYSSVQGWTAVNHVSQTILRAENDLTIPINTIIPAPTASADPQYKRTLSDLTTSSNERWSRPALLGTGAMRASSIPTSPIVAGKIKIGRKGSNKTTASDKSSRSNRARTSNKLKLINPKENANPADTDDTDSSIDPGALVAPARRQKWTGKPFAALVLEALRAATSTDHKLTTQQITKHIEEYRLTTDMEFPALSQTIRASILKNRYPIKPKGLWEHVLEPGKRSGTYKLLPEGFAADAVIPE